MVVTDCTF